MWFKLLVAVVLFLGVVSFNLWSPQFAFLSGLPDSTFLRQWFGGLGMWGPVAVIGSMTLAILVSPVPSAPIALASGAIYGHFWGSIYVLAGSMAGAMMAFSIARFLGHEAIYRRFGNSLDVGLSGSQNFLMATVFITRLMPFISFDIVSYAAGLTPLTPARFAIATLTGIIPASFLLAHFGSQMASNETSQILTAIALLGALVAVPFLVKLVANIRRK